MSNPAGERDDNGNDSDGHADPPPIYNDYKGSQAFAHIVTDQDESVNPNTGSLDFTAPLVELKGVKASVDLTLNLCYSQGSKGIFGLPDGWGFDLPFLVFGDDTNGTSLTAKGRTYMFDATWKDETGYQSGLRYINNHGMSFVKAAAETPLPSGQSGNYLYTLCYPDGVVYYLDSGGRLLEQDDLYGNYIFFSYGGANNSRTVRDGSQLVSIRDSWGQTTKLDYGQGSITITIPSGDTAVVNYTDFVNTAVDALGQATTFTSGDFNGQKVLTQIQYPSGLRSTFEYQGLAFLDPSGKEGQFPAVKAHKSYDGDALVKSSTWQYGVNYKGNTYTGRTLDLKMIVNQDALMELTGDPASNYMSVYRMF